jgi:mRNA-degrading endonuclease RelE of RelBE toxin-antitoxin system
MNSRLTAAAVKNYISAPANIRRAFDKQVKLLSENLHHPSLHAKKYDEAKDLWQARVNRDWRFYFLIQDETYLILAIIPHPK